MHVLCATLPLRKTHSTICSVRVVARRPGQDVTRPHILSRFRPSKSSRASLLPPRQNSKSEARNPKQCQMSQIQNSKRASLQAVHFRDLEIRILNLFRISKFELRIFKGKLDYFVNVETSRT